MNLCLGAVRPTNLDNRVEWPQLNHPGGHDGRALCLRKSVEFIVAQGVACRQRHRAHLSLGGRKAVAHSLVQQFRGSGLAKTLEQDHGSQLKLV
jgi:hypothetical protein